jgi:hypothetical protein
MKIGTKSLLFGVHQVLIHPLFVLWGWKKLYGWPNWKELVCIIIHDWGYWGCNDMDGDEGESHVYYGAYLASRYFHGQDGNSFVWFKHVGIHENESIYVQYYTSLCLFHSRFYSKARHVSASKLCWADKLGTSLMPTWLWVFLASLSGEAKEYLSLQKDDSLKGFKSSRKFFKCYKRELVPKLLKEQGLKI